MSSPTPGPGAPAAKASEVLRESPWHDRFVQHTLEQRLDGPARELLAQEWRYLGPLLAPLPADGRVLDLACGSGPHVLAWAERGRTVVGIDFDQALLVAGRERLGRAAPNAPPAHWTAGDATRLPYRDGSFAIVYCNSLLEHVPQWRLVLAEAARVLRPGGVCVVYTTNRSCPLQQEVNHFPFYSWLPDPVQRRVLKWIMANRRDLVNWTDFPAVNWFTFPGMRRAFAAAGLQPFDRLDLMARQGDGVKRALAGTLSRLPLLKWPYYVYAISMGLYGVKR